MSMAKQFVDEEFWLPSDILCDEFFYGGDKGSGEGKGGLAEAGFRGELPFAFDSNLSSPVESVTETEGSDEEDLMAGLTEQMTHFFFPDDGKGSYAAKAAEGSKDDSSQTMARSPQSTLCAWLASSNMGSPNGPSVVSSPPTSSPPLERRDKAGQSGNLLCEAAGQVMRLHLNGLARARGDGLYDRGILGAPAKSTQHVAAAPKNTSADLYGPNPVLSAQQIQAAHFYHLRRQQIIKQQLSAAWGRQIKARHRGEGFGESGCIRPLDLSPSAWPPLRKPPPPAQGQPPPPPGSGMRAVFLHNTACRKESAGTGVFLPRTAGSKLEPKKKTGFSTVLVPDRVVQALNLNLEEFAAQPRFHGGFVLSHDALLGRSNASLPNLKRNHYNLSPQAATTTQIAAASPPELGLPQEWIY